jgi:hypothetical protein
VTAPTSAATRVRPRSDDDDLSHYYCCDPDVALCGADLSTVPVDESVDTDCVVCVDLDAAFLPCGRDCREGAA